MSGIEGRLSSGRDDPKLDSASAPDHFPTPRAARRLRRHMASAAAALTTRVDGHYRVATVSAITMVSTEPLQLLASIELESQMCDWITAAGFYGLSLLSWHDQVLADRFSGMAPLAPTSFSGIPHFSAITGAPLIATAIAWADCQVVTSLDTGDHRCFVGEALATGVGATGVDDPLIYFLNRYRRLR